MTEAKDRSLIHRLPEELQERRRILLGELRTRTLWFISLRWWVPPAIVVGTFLAQGIGFEFETTALLALAVVIAVYNFLFFNISRRLQVDVSPHRTAIEHFTYWQVGVDFCAMLFLAHFTGGAASPFIFFFIFHIIFASILLPPRWAYIFAGLASIGMIALAAAEYLELISRHALAFHGRSIDLACQPIHVTVEMIFFASSLFITAFFSVSIQRKLRKRIIRLSDLSEAVIALNGKLESLYSVIRAIGPSHELNHLLQLAARELAEVMRVKAVSVKLLTDDGRFLRYEASFGLPDSFGRDKPIDVRQSPLNRRIIEGESFVTGEISQREMFQFGEALEKARLRSVLFVPMRVEGRVIGILGAYCQEAGRFDEADVNFFRQAAGLLSIAVENTRAYESIQHLSDERSWFLMKVTHNLRAPLAAMTSMLEVVKEEYLGPLNDEQKEHLRRVDRRVRTMLDTINELLALANGRNRLRPLKRGKVDLVAIAGRILRTFQDEAKKKGLRFDVRADQTLPIIIGDPDMIEQLLENLVSNAVKYTKAGGSVFVEILPEDAQNIRIEVRDTGIGIPTESVSNIFTEFYRAENAKQMEELGTGLGLTIVKDIVDQHHGQIRFESMEGLGTLFSVRLPATSGEIHDANG